MRSKQQKIERCRYLDTLLNKESPKLVTYQESATHWLNQLEQLMSATTDQVLKMEPSKDSMVDKESAWWKEINVETLEGVENISSVENNRYY